MKTRQGCEVIIERVGASVGVTVVQPSGKRDLFACGADEAAEVAQMLAPALLDEIERLRTENDVLRRGLAAAVPKGGE